MEHHINYKGADCRNNLSDTKRNPSASLLEACIAFAGMGKTNTCIHPFRTEYSAEHEKDGLKVEFEDGTTDFGTGSLDVYLNGDLVLSVAPHYTNEREVIEVIAPPLKAKRPYAVKTYMPGDWEKRILRASKK